MTIRLLNIYKIGMSVSHKVIAYKSFGAETPKHLVRVNLTYDTLSHEGVAMQKRVMSSFSQTFPTNHYITSHHITSHHITSHHNTSHHITSHHMT